MREHRRIQDIRILGRFLASKFSNDKLHNIHYLNKFSTPGIYAQSQIRFIPLVVLSQLHMRYFLWFDYLIPSFFFH
ncbi:hypothetical protein NMG60_11026832 [Bertholletia excelsa]